MNLPENEGPERRPQRAAAQGEEAAVPLPEDALVLLPVRDLVLFPGMIVPIAVGRPASVAAVQQAVREERPVGVILQRDPAADDPGPDGLHRIGTVANILRYMTAPDGSHHIVCQGVQRFRILDLLEGTPFPVARVFRIPEPESRLPGDRGPLPQPAGAGARGDRALAAGAAGPARVGAGDHLARRALRHRRPPTWTSSRRRSRRSSRPSTSARAWTGSRGSSPSASRCCGSASEIGRQTKAAFDERQREAVLREQMAAIQRQLGEGDGKAEEVAELSEAIAKAGMPEEVEAQARKELRRYERMPEAAGEAGMVRT